MPQTTQRYLIDAGTKLCAPWKIDAIQSSGLSKGFLDSKNSRVNDCILISVGKLYLDDPYVKMFTISSSQWLNKITTLKKTIFCNKVALTV